MTNDIRFCWLVVALWITMMMGTGVKHSWELRSNHPLHDVVDKVNDKGPYIGLVMAFPAEEVVLEASGVFIPDPDCPLIRLSGKKFNIGTIKRVPVIYVMTGEQIVNAGVTVQTLYDVFDMVGVVHYGIAGTTNASLMIGDVSIPRYLAFTGSWDWLEKSNSGNSSEEQGLELWFGEFNLPSKGDNLLGEIEFSPTQVFTSDGDGDGDGMEKMFWIPVDPYWFNLSTQIKDVELQQQQWLKNVTPKAVFGLRGSTADVYLNNAAYGRFLFEKLNVSTVDEESAAVVMTSLSNGKPCVVFRGVSDQAGGGGGEKMQEEHTTTSSTTVAAINALNMAVQFIEIVGNEMLMSSM